MQQRDSVLPNDLGRSMAHLGIAAHGVEHIDAELYGVSLLTRRIVHRALRALIRLQSVFQWPWELSHVQRSVPAHLRAN